MNLKEIRETFPLDSHRYAHPWMRPLPLEDPEVAHLTEEGKIAFLITKCHREYDWHDQVSKRPYRAEMVRRLELLATDLHPVIQEWEWLSKATNQEYRIHVRHPRERAKWEEAFRNARTTQAREKAVHWLMRYTTEHHPMVQLYLQRTGSPESRTGWWELEPAPKKPSRARGKSGGTRKKGTTT